MANNDWYPKRMADRIPWHANFDVQAQAKGTTYGLSAEDKTDILNDADNVPLIVNYVEASRAFAQSVTEWAEIMFNAPIGAELPSLPSAPSPPIFADGSKPSIVPRTRQHGGIIKADADYTAEVGESFGIIAPAPGPAEAPSISRAEALAGTSQVRLSLDKGSYDVIAVDMRRGAEPWVQIGVSQTATFVDTTAPLAAGQPEQREYRVQGMQNNLRTGDVSPAVSVVTVP
jgi:hypothetical protein